MWRVRVMATGLAICVAAAALAPTSVEARTRQGDERINPARLAVEHEPGTIVISLSKRKLYLVTADGQTISYRVAVGKGAKAWTGTAYVQGKFVRPDWMPPAMVRKDNPKLPDVIPGGAPNNPMGERALMLNLDEIAIHGTTDAMRRSIGTAASYGCIRMLNEDIVDLFDRVTVGTKVVAIR